MSLTLTHSHPARSSSGVAVYEPTAEGLERCPEHGHVIGALEVCPDCPTGEFAETAATQPSRQQAQQDEMMCREVRDEILGIARSYKEQRDENESKDRIGFSTVCKLYDCALKWHRAAMEERMKRGDEEFAAWLVEEKRRLLDRGTSH